VPSKMKKLRKDFKNNTKRNIMAGQKKKEDRKPKTFSQKMSTSFQSSSIKEMKQYSLS